MKSSVTLSEGAVKLIHDAVDKLYDRVLARFLDKKPVGDKKIFIGFKPRVTLSTLFIDSAAEERAKADENVLKGLLRIAEGYIESQRHAVRSRVTRAVDAWLGQAAAGGVTTDIETVLGGELAEVYGKATSDMRRIIETESTTVRNTGILDGVVRVNAAVGIEDPIVYWVVVKDIDFCDECRRLHLMPNGITPRLWYLSEVGRGYHKKGEENPKLSGLHPWCRCVLASLMPGYGFEGGSTAVYVSPDHDELAVQRDLDKNEDPLGDPLEKAEVDTRDVVSHFKSKLGFTASEEGGNHTLYYHPEAPHIKLIVQRGSHGATMNNLMLKKIGTQTGTKWSPRDRTFVPDPNSEHAGEYVRRGLLPGSQPTPTQMTSWKPADFHQHVETSKVQSTNPNLSWTVNKYKKMLQGPEADKVPPVDVMDAGDGNFVVSAGDEQHEAARQLGHSHIPVRVVGKL